MNMDKEKALNFIDGLMATANVKKENAIAEQEKFKVGDFEYLLVSNDVCLQTGYLLGLKHARELVEEM